MHWKHRLIVTWMAVIAAALISVPAFAASDHEKTHAGKEAEHQEQSPQALSDDPLTDEMVVLDAVFRTVVSGVALSDGPRVHEALEKMHGTMERTHEGVRHGTVTLKKNADRLKEFVEQDRRFHRTLEDLAVAARRNDGDAMLTLTKKLLDGCVRCHRDFRQP